MDGEKLRVEPVESDQPSSEGAPTCRGAQGARIVRPVRNQVEFVMEELDALVPEDHVVRGIWAFLERLDLSDFYAAIRAVPGRSAARGTRAAAPRARWPCPRCPRR